MRFELLSKVSATTATTRISVLNLLLLRFIGLLWVLRLCGGLRSLYRITFDPPLNCELVAVFLELSEQVCTLFVLNSNLSSQLSLQGLRLDLKQSLLIFS